MLNLEQYKELLDKNTLDAMTDGDEGQSRYVSFKMCLAHLANELWLGNKPNVLEIGTCRSYVSGAFEGCNSDDTKYWNPNDFSKWDWGAGCFSLVFGQTDVNLTTLDIVPPHIKRCKTMTDSLGIKCRHIVSDSVSFLKTTNEKYDLVYLDSGDVFPVAPSVELQLLEAMAVVERNLIKPNGLILIDDVKNNTPRKLGDLTNKLGKSDKSIPYLLSHGYETIYAGYQYIMKKKS